MDRDWRRIEPVIDWILSQQLDFQGDSAFASTFLSILVEILSSPYTVTKTLSMFNYFVDCSWPFFSTVADKYMRLFLDNANTGYAEVILPRSCLVTTLIYRLGTNTHRVQHDFDTLAVMAADIPVSRGPSYCM